jgi:predicted regulator of Ras-like GTPase activity (Roadblock/LC7/MglB family)
MFSLPLLNSDDIASMDGALGDFVSASGARLALFIDEGGFVVTRQGSEAEIDTATLGALAANSFAATQAIARVIGDQDHSVTCLYQEGKENSLLILSVEGFGFAAVVFPAEIGVGSVKFYGENLVAQLGGRLTAARERTPGEGLDLSSLNIEDATPLFRRRAAP